MLARKLSAAAKSIASSDIEELLGGPCLLLFLLMFTLCEFGPVWNLELPNLEVKPAVFLPYFPAYEMTVNFDYNLDKRHLATQENRQVVTAYFKSNTSKGKDTMRPFFFVEDTAGDVKDDDADNDDGEDDENRSNDDDIDDFDEDNDSKSEVNHKKKVNDEPQKEKRKRKALDTAEEESPKKKVCFYFQSFKYLSGLAKS